MLMKVQGLRAGFVDQCMHSAKYKECRTSRIHGVQNKQGKVAITKGKKRQISIPQKPDAFGAQASKDSTIKTAALQASMQPQPAPTPQVMPFVHFVAQASHWFWLDIRLSTLRVVS